MDRDERTTPSPTTSVVPWQAPPPDAPPPPALFRREVLEARQSHWLGTVLLAPRLSHRFFAAFAAVSAVAIIALLLIAGYTRTARVTGWLVPGPGLMRVFTPQPGVVTELFVAEGQEVKKGERLLILSSELQSAAGGATQAGIVRKLEERRRSLHEQRRKQEQLFAQQEKALSQRVAALRLERAQLEQEIELQRSRVDIAADHAGRSRKLRGQGFLSESASQQTEAVRLEQAGRLAALQRDRTAKAREQIALESELRELPLKAQGEIAATDRDIGTLEQEMAQVEARRELAILAPADGTVSAILAERGGHANASAPLLSIVPAGAALEAHLYSPSRTVGFVQPGQRVLIRYEAYPYQKFGHHEGVVTSVSRSPLSPAELPAQLAGVFQAPGAKDPVYRITVHPAKQAIDVYGKPIALQPGAQLEADIALERRKLYEWLLDPLYTVTRKRGA